jgi:cellulose synthase operon protein C
MRKYVVAAVVVVGVGVAASIFVLPNSSDIVRQQATDVQAIDLGKVDVDAEYAQGRRSFPIIAALADKKIAAGDRPGAVTLWEEYVAANPNDAQGRKKLAEQYQLAGRQDDYNKQLEAIAAAEPTEANLRVLSDIYNANKDYPRQVDVLKKILVVTQGNNPQAFADLATIQIVVNDKDGALKTLEDLKVKHPGFTNYSVTRIMVTVLAEKGEVDRAFETAQNWINAPTAAAVPVTAAPSATPAASAESNADPRPKELADLCNILHYSGHADKAVALVDPHLDMLERSPELVVAYVNADVTAGRADHAYALLQKIDEAGKMSPALYPTYLELAIKREDVAAAETIANKLEVNAFNEEQALNIIELSRANNATSVLKTLLTRFSDPKALEGKPVLAAVIAIHQNDKLQDKKIETALNTQLQGTQRVRLAEACARAQKTACFDAIIKQFPAIDQMSPSQIAEFAQLHIIADRPKDVIEAIGIKAALPNAHADVVHAHHRLAAAAGRIDILKPWLETNANTAPVGSLQELYYIASDHHQGAVASDLAERLYARDPSPVNRTIFTNALIAAGNNEKAIELLREQMNDTGANDGLYLATLTKLAHKNPAYRKELADYAEAALRSDRGDARQQLNYAYILINNGRKDVATPYAKKYSAERGGEWKKMYAQLTQKPGVSGKAVKPIVLTREQRIEMSRSKTISEANKRQIAFSLLNDGYKADAAVIFQDLASNKGPDSQEVKDLMYLWGGKLNAEQLEWVRARAATASAYDKNRWAELINNAADDTAVVKYVSATPDALYNRPLRQKFFRTLATTGSRQNYDTAMRDWVSQTTDVAALSDYASTAQAYGFREAALNGYNRVLALDPNNSKALSQISAMQFSKGKYAEADKNITQYLAVQSQQAEPDGDAAQAHFYKGELLRRAGNKAGSEAEFLQVIKMTQDSGSTASDALSRLYTAQFRVGQHDAAKSGFNQLLAEHPDNKGILADYMSALIEYRYLSEATRVANQYDKTSPYYNKGAALIGQSAHVASVEKFSGGREIKISFDRPLEGKAPMRLADQKKLAWLEQSTVGYDSVTLSAKPGYVVRYIPTAQEQFEIVPSAAAELSPQEETQRQEDLRLQLLYARIEQDSGQTARANERIAVLKQYYPADPQLISYEASLASASGNTSQALDLLRQAQSMSPENEGIAQQLRSAQMAGVGGSTITNYVKLDQAYRGIGKNDEFITTGSGAVGLGNRNELGFTIQNDILHTNNTRRGSDGRFGDYDLTRQRGEIYAARTLEGGQRLQGSLFANNKTAGVGGYLGLAKSPIGNLELFAEYHRPYWDFVEAVAEHTNRDRVGFKNYANLTPKTSVGIEASVNNYNVDVLDNARKTALVRLSAVQELQAKTETQPYLGVGYGFDGEYKLGDAKTVLDFGGTPFQPFPLVDREVHSLTGIYRDDLGASKNTHVQLVGGIAYDRFSKSTFPLIDGRVDHDINSAWQVGARGRYALQTNNTDNKQLDLGADVIYKF